MGRRVVGWLACASLTLLAACGGGGGGGDSSGGPGGVPTPLPNQVCDSTNRVCISVDQLVFLLGDEVTYTVTTRNASGNPESAPFQVTVGTAVSILNPSSGSGTTSAQGTFQGTIKGALGGSALLTATRTGLGVSAAVRLSVQGAGATRTATRPPTPGGPSTQTPTPASSSSVTTIFMETDKFTISSQMGGIITVSAYAFDQDNRPLNGVNLLFDFSPKVGVLRPIYTTTRSIVLPGDQTQDGVAKVTIEIPPGTASPGQITVTASAADVNGSVSFTITPGNATVEIETVLAQISDATCGADVGGGLTVSAIVFDADNKPINDVNVLFVTPVGEVIPLTSVSEVVNGQGGTAQTTLQVPAGAPVLTDDSGNVLPYTVRARAGGVEGSVQLFVVPGRDECRAGPGGNTEEGEAASVTVSASPNRIRIRGAGAREVSSIVATVFDNQGARLNNAEVRFSISSATSATGALLLPINLNGGYCSAPIGKSCTTAAECDPEATCDTDVRNRFTSFTDRAGNAQIQLRSGERIGTVTVVAEIPSALGEAFTQACTNPRTPGERCIISNGLVVTVTAGLPGVLTLAGNTRGIINNDGTNMTTLTAIVTDTRNNTVEDGTPVSFSVVPFDDDDVTSRRVSIVGFPVTNAAPPCDVTPYEQQTGNRVVAQPGNATTCMTFPSGLAGTEVQVQMESGSTTELGTLTLPGGIGDLVAVANPPTVVVTDTEPGVTVLTAVVGDDDGNPLPNVKVIFDTEVGGFEGQIPPFRASDISDANGVASVTLRVPVGTEEQEFDVAVYGGGIERELAAQVPITVRSTGNMPGAGDPQSIVLESATPATIGVKNSGRPDQSIIAVSVRDQLNTPLGNVPVSFVVNAVGGVQVNPVEAVTDEDGVARTSIVAGTLASAVQITATVDVNEDGVFEVVNQFTAVNIVGGAPNADRFSLAANFINVAGRVTFGLEDTITAFLNDHFGNAVAPGTVVNFTTNGASVFSQVASDTAGRASTTLISEGGVPENGIVTVLATTRGEEPFIDSNGNGAHDTDEQFRDVPEPFIDFNGNGRFDPPEPFTDQNGNRTFDSGEPYTDSNANGVYDPNANERFIDVNSNGAWDAAQSPGVWSATALLSVSSDVTFSAHTQAQLLPSSFTIPDGGSQAFSLVVSDLDLNPIVGGSTISFSLGGEGAEGADIVGVPNSITLPDSATFGALVPGLNTFNFLVVDGATGEPANTANLSVNVTISSNGTTGAGGNGSVFVSSLGQLLPAPTGTPQATPTFTPTPTDTPPPSTPTITVTGTPPSTSTATPTATATPTDTIPASATATATITATGTPTMPAASAQFVNAVPTAIGVRASGLAEQSVLTFRVTDVASQPVSGIPVTFTLVGLGGETVNPATAITNANGQVTTTLTSGTRTTTVQVIARVDANGDGTPDLQAQSTAVAILGAPPSMSRFSVASERANVAGRVAFGIENVVSAFVNDRFGNAVPPNTAVSFVTNGASIVDQETTGTDGIASATLITEGQVPPTGIVTITAFTHGEEGFLDNNGNGRFDVGTDTITTDNVFEPYIDFRPLPGLDGACTQPAPSPFCNLAFDPLTPFEQFIDVGTLNGLWDTQGQMGVFDDDILVSASTTVTFSGPLQAPVAQADGGAPVDNFVIPDGGALGFTLLVHDDLVNPIVGGSTISVQSNAGTIVGGNITVPDGQSFNQLVTGLTRFRFVLLDSSPGEGMAPQNVNVTVSVTSDNGNGSTIVASGVILPPPTPAAP